MVDSTSPRPLVVLLTVGDDAPERCNAGLTIAAAAASAGASVSVWLVGEAVWLATPGRAAAVALPHAAPLDGVFDLLLGEGSVTVSAQSAARRGIGEGDVIAGVQLGGAQEYVEEIVTPGVQALVF